MSSVNVTFNLKTAGFAVYANQTLTFKLLQVSADKSPASVILPGIVTATSAANGTGSVALFVNSLSDIASTFEVIFPNREKGLFKIPLSAVSSGTITLSELLVDHVPGGSDAPQNSVYDAAVAFARQRSNHTGTQLLSTISDGTEGVQDIVGGMVTGNTETGITVTYEDSDGTLDFVVASQTDQNFTNADHTKLDGIEALADKTDTTNVTAAGALMDSEMQDTTGAAIKSLTLPVSTTINAFARASLLNSNATLIKSALGVTDTSAIAGFVPNSITFPATSAFLSIANSADLNVGTGDFTLSFWARLDSSETQPVLDKFSGTGYSLKFSSGSLILTMQDPGGPLTCTFGTDLNDNKWHVYVVSVDRSGDAVAYIDNVAQTALSVTSVDATLDNTTVFRIGFDGSNAGSGIALGNYIALHKSALTDAQAAQVYFSADAALTAVAPTLMVDLRKADKTFTDVSASPLPIVTNGSITFNQERITSLDGVGDINCSSISADVAATGLNVIFDGTDTGDNKITLTDNLASALDITESTNSYLKFTTTNSGEKVVIGKALDISGATTAADVTGTNVLATTTLGYKAGSGGTVTQATTGKGAAVALNKISGEIVMDDASLANNATAVFTFNNTTIAATDVVIVNIASGVAVAGSYQVTVGAVAANSCSISVLNVSGDARTDTIKLNFAVIKAVKT